MSVFRLEIDMAFATEPEMKAMLNLIESMRDKLQKQEGELPIPCKVRYHECMHDEGLPCGNYTTIEFDGVTDHGAPAEDAIPETVKTAIKAPLQTEKEALVAEKDALVAEKDALVAEKEVIKAIPTGTTHG